MTTTQTVGSRRTCTGPVLVTGVTGFLGSRLVAALLRRSSRPIVCLVRGSDAADAQKRGRSALVAALRRSLKPEETNRLRWIRGNMQEVRLGQNGQTWLELVGSVEEIFHCAASVRFDLPLHEAHAINVDGTKNVFALAEAGRVLGCFRRFHHVSTAYAAGIAGCSVDADYLPVDRARNFRNTYERTKARSERFLRKQHAVPVTIYRPSIVAGSIESGATDNWNVLYVPMRMIARGQLPILPSGGRGLVDAVGVDYVVDGILHFASSEAEGHAAHHLTAGPDPFTVHEFVRTVSRVSRALGREPSDTKVVTTASWRTLSLALRLAARAPSNAGDVRRWGRLGSRGVASFEPYAPYTNVSTVFDSDAERAELRKSGIEMPPATRFLETITEFAVATDFGRCSSPADPARHEEAIV